MTPAPPAIVEARFRLVFTRAYHVGAGHGRGPVVDSSLFTEHGGGAAGDEESGRVPVIRYPAGVLRQASYGLLSTPPLRRWRLCGRSGRSGAYERDRYCRTRPRCPLCRIFGSPAFPSPWSFSTARPVDLSGTGGHEPIAASRVVHRTSVDLRARRAEEGKLFSEELGAPLVFEFRASRENAGPEALEELAFLQAAAATLRGVGSGRRRGRGECIAELQECNAANTEALWTRFRSGWLDREPGDAEPTAAPVKERDRKPVGDAGGERGRNRSPVRRAEDFSRVWSSASVEAHRWRLVRLLARAEEPIIAGRRALSGNLQESEPFVPGFSLLGALAEWSLRHRRIRPDERVFLEAFRGGAVLFPDLQPVREAADGSWTPTMVVPEDLYTCPRHPGPAGEDPHGTWSTLAAGYAQNGQATLTCPRCEEELGRGRGSRLRPPGRLVTLERDWQEVDFHLLEESKIEIDPDIGTVRGESLYHRETIPAGTLLEGILWIRGDVSSELAERGIVRIHGNDAGPSGLRLGKRHRRGYGKLKLSWEDLGTSDAPAPREQMRHRIEFYVKERGWISIVLGSRLLLRDAYGRYRQRLTPADLDLELPADRGECAVSWQEVGGFWRHIGLPRRRALGLEPGSVLRVSTEELPDPVAEELVTRLTDLALAPPRGERIEGGCGRLIVAPPVYDRLSGLAEVPADLEMVGGPWDAAERTISESLARGGWRLTDAMPSPSEEMVRDYARELGRRESESRAKTAFGDHADSWHTVARLLHGGAGRPAEELEALLIDRTGGPAEHLAARGEERERRTEGGDDSSPFLQHSEKGEPLWKELLEMLEETADRKLPTEEKARRTRALAEAIIVVTEGGRP